MKTNTTPTAVMPGTEKLNTLPVLQSIDTATGLSLLMGDTLLYVQMLRDFITEYEGAADRLLYLILDNEAEAKRLAHTIKGSSAQIGATALHKIAEELNRTLAIELIPSFADELNKVIEELKESRICSQVTLFSKKEPLTYEIRQNLMELLADSVNGKKTHLFYQIIDELKNYSLSPEDEALSKELKCLIDTNQFDEAQAAFAQKFPQK